MQQSISINRWAYFATLCSNCCYNNWMSSHAHIVLGVA
jgi:hypothetical protein